MILFVKVLRIVFSTKYWEKYTILCKLYTFLYNISYSFVYSHYHFLFISSDIASVSDIDVVSDDVKVIGIKYTLRLLFAMLTGILIKVFKSYALLEGCIDLN